MGFLPIFFFRLDSAEPVFMTSSDLLDQRWAISVVHPKDSTISRIEAPRAARTQISILCWNEASCPPFAFAFFVFCSFSGGARFGFFLGVNFFLAICMSATIFSLQRLRLPEIRRFSPKVSVTVILHPIPENLFALGLRSEWWFKHDEPPITRILCFRLWVLTLKWNYL